MTTQTEVLRAGEFLLDQGPSRLVFEAGTITGGDYVAGRVMGQITASSKWTAHDPAAADGSQTAKAILYDAVAAAAADAPGVLVRRLAAVNGDLLTWKTGIAGGDKSAGIAALATAFVLVQ
jgi:hypothetical protein